MSSSLPTADTQGAPSKQPDFDALPPQKWVEQWHPTEEFPTPQSVQNDKFSHVINDALSYAPSRQDYRLGVPGLSVAPYREYLVDTIAGNQSAVVVSETGTGKSSQIGLYGLEAAEVGINRVFVSSPRILAARDLMKWARANLGPEYASLAGYLTGTARDSDADSGTRLFYVTEALLFKMINRGKLGEYDMVINDEAHERTPATVALQGLMKEIMTDNPNMKLLVSSATIDAERQAKFLTDRQTNQPAPVIILPGRQYPITDMHTDKPVAQVAREYMAEHNLLIFEPGLSRQTHTASTIADRKSGHTIHLLHGDLSPAEQTAALNPEDKHHIVANRIGETSITPPRKDVVIDSGLSNIGIFDEGVRVLKTVHSSQATMIQRRGRVGRTSPGIYIVAAPDNATPKAYEDRDAYDIPPTEVSSLASYIIEFLARGRQLQDIDLLDRPSAENLAHDYRLLQRLGAITIVSDEALLTDVGKAMTELPLDVQLARMLIAAREVVNSQDVDSSSVRLQVAAAVSIAQVNGILSSGKYTRRRYLLSQRHEPNISEEKKSDFLFELDVFIRMATKHQAIIDSGVEDPTERLEAYLRSKDILINRYYKAQRTFEELCRREGLEYIVPHSPTSEERRAIIGCQITGAEEVFVQRSKHMHRDIRGESRRLGRKSTIDQSLARVLVGSAFDLVGMKATGHFRRPFIVGASAVSTDQLLQHAPHRITRKTLGHGVTKEGDVLERQALYFDGDMYFDQINTTPQYNLETREFILTAMMTGIARSAYNNGQALPFHVSTKNALNAQRQWSRAQELEHKSPVKLMTDMRFKKLVAKITNESVEIVPLSVTDPAELDVVIPRTFLGSLVRPSRKKDIPEILRRSPDAITVVSDEDTKMYLPVTYRNNIAYITIPRDLVYRVTPANIAAVAEHHLVKLKIGKGQYYQSDVIFARIEERRQSPQRQTRLKRQAEAAARVSTPEGYLESIERLQTGKKSSIKRKILPTVIVQKEPVVRVRKQRGRPKETKEPKKTT